MDNLIIAGIIIILIILVVFIVVVVPILTPVNKKLSVPTKDTPAPKVTFITAGGKYVTVDSSTRAPTPNSTAPPAPDSSSNSTPPPAPDSSSNSTSPPAPDSSSNLTPPPAPPPQVVILQRQSLGDQGYDDKKGNLTRGWYDVQNQGAANDYCAYTGPSATADNWGCALAGGTGYTVTGEAGAIAPRIPFKARQTINDSGYGDLPNHLVRGWYDVQKQGIANDYCSYTGTGTEPINWSCALAGAVGYKPYSDTSSPAPRLPLLDRQNIADPGYGDKPENLIRGWYDVQKQGVANDYCAYSGSAPTPENWGCALAGGSGYVKSGEAGSIAPRKKSLPRQVITDQGYNDSPSNLKKGWYDVQNQGVANDYCAYIGNGVNPNNWRCALAGSAGYTSFSEKDSPAPRQAPLFNKQAIKVGGSSKCADVTGGTKDDVWLQIYECGANNISQQWTYDANAPNQPIVAALNNKCMDYDASTGRVNTRTCNGGNTQRWHYVDGPKGGKQFQSDANSEVCLNAQGGGLNQGDRLGGYHCSEGGTNSQWAL